MSREWLRQQDEWYKHDALVPRNRMLEHEVRDILERDTETGVLRLDPASGGKWQIRKGNFVTLSEAFWFGKDLCSCYDIYRWYLTLPVWIQKRHHPAPSQPERKLNSWGNWVGTRGHWLETGSRGLPRGSGAAGGEQ